MSAQTTSAAQSRTRADDRRWYRRRPVIMTNHEVREAWRMSMRGSYRRRGHDPYVFFVEASMPAKQRDPPSSSSRKWAARCAATPLAARSYRPPGTPTSAYVLVPPSGRAIRAAPRGACSTSSCPLTRGVEADPRLLGRHGRLLRRDNDPWATPPIATTASTSAKLHATSWFS